MIVGHVGGCWSWLINDARMELKLNIIYIIHNMSCIYIIIYIYIVEHVGGWLINVRMEPRLKIHTPEATPWKHCCELVL